MNRRTFIKMTGVNAGALALARNAVSQPQSRSGAAPEIVVVGAGAFGGWTALYLREMGVSVTLVDQYGPGNSRASSGGESRQIRAGYADRELYSRWAMQALDRWKAREAEWGRKLLYNTGQLTIAREWTGNDLATRAVFDKLKIPYEMIGHDELVRRFPQVAIEEGALGFFTPTTHIVKAREGCVAVAQAFERKGGKFVTAKADLGRRSGGRLQDVTLSPGGTLSAQTFVFACGPWLPKVFPDVMKNKLNTPRRVIYFYGSPSGDGRFGPSVLPALTVAGGYTFPDIEGRGIKVAPAGSSGVVDPDTHERTISPEELRRGRDFATKWFPALKGQPIVEQEVAQIENSVDQHFIITRHPELENVWIAGGGSAHGYKHGIVVGDYIANRVVGKDKYPELEATFRLKDRTF